MSLIPVRLKSVSFPPDAFGHGLRVAIRTDRVMLGESRPPVRHCVVIMSRTFTARECATGAETSHVRVRYEKRAAVVDSILRQPRRPLAVQLRSVAACSPAKSDAGVPLPLADPPSSFLLLQVSRGVGLAKAARRLPKFCWGHLPHTGSRRERVRGRGFSGDRLPR